MRNIMMKLSLATMSLFSSGVSVGQSCIQFETLKSTISGEWHGRGVIEDHATSRTLDVIVLGSNLATDQGIFIQNTFKETYRDTGEVRNLYSTKYWIVSEDNNCDQEKLELLFVSGLDPMGAIGSDGWLENGGVYTEQKLGNELYIETATEFSEQTESVYTSKVERGGVLMESRLIHYTKISKEG